MSITVREYGENDIKGMISAWNEVVRDGVAFPQTEELDFESGKKFFAEQTCCAVATDDTEKIFFLPNFHFRIFTWNSPMYTPIQPAWTMGMRRPSRLAT